MSVCENFASTIATDSFTTPFLRIKKGILQGDCLSHLVFNWIINTFFQFTLQVQFSLFGYSLTNLIRPTHWFQFAEDAALVTGQEYKTKILLNVFSIWCTWSHMIIRVDKCHTFGIMKEKTISIQTKQKQPSRNVHSKRCSENMQQIYRRTPMPKWDFNKVAKQLYWNQTSAWVFSCKFSGYLQNTFY